MAVQEQRRQSTKDVRPEEPVLSAQSASPPPAQHSRLSLYCPEGSSTQDSGILGPKPIQDMVFGTRELKHCVLGLAAVLLLVPNPQAVRFPTCLDYYLTS